MTTVEEQAVTDSTQPMNDQREATTARSAEAPEPSVCGSYKEAKYLASSRRRDGSHAYAIYNIARGAWCVR